MLKRFYEKEGWKKEGMKEKIEELMGVKSYERKKVGEGDMKKEPEGKVSEKGAVSLGGGEERKSKRKREEDSITLVTEDVSNKKLRLTFTASSSASSSSSSSTLRAKNDFMG